MSHDIEQFEDGTSAFFSNREVPWHRLGTVTEGAQTAENALQLAQLDWEVKKADDPITTTVTLGNNKQKVISLSDKFMTYRNHPKKGVTALGVVGRDYSVIQNAEAFEFLNLLVDEYGAHFETAGSLKDGKQVFVSMKLPDSIKLAGSKDEVEMYLMATTSHDGSKAFQVAVTPIRVVCANTVAYGLQRAKAKWSIRHTTNAQQKVQQARESMGLAFAYVDEWETVANKLASEKFDTKQLDAFLKKVVHEPRKDTDRRKNNVEATRNEIKALAINAPTQENIRGTKWAAYNAVVEWADWARPVRGKSDEAKALARATRNFRNSDKMKQRALALLTK